MSAGAEIDARPEFMAILGLLPPFTIEDVHMAYRSKVREAHPDSGGDEGQFRKLHEAYERATEYAEFHGSRRSWLGARIEEYVRRESVIAEIKRRGGQAILEERDWVRREFGDDFAQVMDRLTTVLFSSGNFSDDDIDFLTREQAAFKHLQTLHISGSGVTDRGVLRLRIFTTLRQLGLRGTSITSRALELVPLLPQLEWLDIGKTQVSWWARWRLKRSFPKLTIVT
jgi:hypothetical protein